MDKDLELLCTQLIEKPSLMEKIQSLLDSVGHGPSWFDTFATIRFSVLPRILGEEASEALMEYIYRGESVLPTEGCPNQQVRDYLAMCRDLYESVLDQATGYMMDPFGVWMTRASYPIEDRIAVTITRNDGQSMTLQFNQLRLQQFIELLKSDLDRFENRIQELDKESEE